MLGCYRSLGAEGKRSEDGADSVQCLSIKLNEKYDINRKWHKQKIKIVLNRYNKERETDSIENKPKQMK